MTHDDLTAKLRDPRPLMAVDAQTMMLDAADRLDRYRDLIKRLSYSLPATEVFRYLHRDIREALK